MGKMNWNSEIRFLDVFSGTSPGLGGGFGWFFSASSATLREKFRENIGEPEIQTGKLTQEIVAACRFQSRISG
jgi:hypothetical protein